MPEAYVHAIESLLAFGRSYFSEHQEKDAPSRMLGREHRVANHDWYQAFGIVWDFKHPTPDWIAEVTEQIGKDFGDEQAEIYQAVFLAHDLTDRLHDSDSPDERKMSVAFHIFFAVSSRNTGEEIRSRRHQRPHSPCDRWAGDLGIESSNG